MSRAVIVYFYAAFKFLFHRAHQPSSNHGVALFPIYQVFWSFYGQGDGIITSTKFILFFTNNTFLILVCKSLKFPSCNRLSLTKFWHVTLLIWRHEKNMGKMDPRWIFLLMTMWHHWYCLWSLSTFSRDHSIIDLIPYKFRNRLLSFVMIKMIIG